MKPFYVYSRHIFAESDGFYRPGIQSYFGRVSNGEIEFRHELKFNNWGFRDDVDFRERGDAPEIRIVALGDSFTANLDAPIPWPLMLEERLRKEFGPAIKVYNLGLTGAGPLNWIGLEERVRRIAPDIILMPFYSGIMERSKIRFSEDGNAGRFYCHYSFPFLLKRPVGVVDARFPDISPNELSGLARELQQETTASAGQPRILPLTLVTRLLTSAYWRLRGMSWVMGASQAAVSKMLGWAPHIILGQFPAQADFEAQGAPGIQEQFLAGLARERKNFAT